MVNFVFIATPLVGDMVIVPPDGGLFNLILRTVYDGMKYVESYTLILSVTSSSLFNSLS